jgi:DNA-binding HxlR family transcriptional regulator
MERAMVPACKPEAAAAFDLVNTRWALLHIVRELAAGPLRFTDLHRRLAGISTNALTVRLRELERADVVRRRLLPRPAASVVYELSDRGAELGEIALALDRWAREHRPHE